MFSRYDNGKVFVSWDQLNANPGDIIEIRRLSFEIPSLYIKIITYSHFGIYAGNGMTIHFVNLYQKLGIVRYEPLESVANGSLCRLVRCYDVFQ
jgi:cell wall-associated NlpC family hydrolase